MEDYLTEIKQYLPLYYPSKENEEFIEYLSDAYLENVKSEKYQISFVVFHMLYMSFLYKTLWFLKSQGIGTEAIEQICRQNRLGDIYNLFDFSVVREKDSFNLIRCLEFHPNQIRKFSSLVENRNHCSHASGRIEYEQSEVDGFIQRQLKYTDEIFLKTETALSNLLNRFIEENWNPEERQYLLAYDTVNAFIKENILSSKDIEFLYSYEWPNVSNKSNNPQNIHTKVLFLIFLAVAQELGGLDGNLFMESFPMLLNGFKEQEEINLRDLINDEFSSVIERLSKSEQEEFEKIIDIYYGWQIK